jgi:hypothetical protein
LPQEARAPALAVTAFGIVTASILASQIVLSRLLAGTMTYYYAFMLVSLAMLGLAAGALLVQLFPERFPLERRWIQASGFSYLMGASLFAGTLSTLVLLPQVDFTGPLSSSSSDYLGLAALFWCQFPSFFFGGLVVSLILAHAGGDFHRLYGVDLVSAAGGCLIAIPLMVGNTPVEVLLKVLAVLPVAASAFFALAAGRRRAALVGLALAGVFAVSAGIAARSPEVARPPHVGSSGRPTVLSEWNAISAVRVHPVGFFTWSLSSEYNGERFPMLDLLIDGLGGTQIVAFDGDPKSLQRYTYLDQDLTALAQVLVPSEGRQLIIGPGGGVDILQAVRQGRTDVTAVEINPLVARVVNEDLAGFSGQPYRLPGVRVFIENGRTFVRRSRELWHLIALTWVDTGGSATALAFSENYLYTVEAYEDFLRHLNDQGFLSFLRALGVGLDLDIDSLRGVAVGVEALTRLGAAQPGEHMVVAASLSPHFGRPMCLVLIKRSPYTTEEVATVRQFLRRLKFFALWLPDGGSEMEGAPRSFQPFAALTAAIIRSRPADRERLYRDAPLDIRPSTDDNPFYFVERAGPRRPAGAGVKQLGTFLYILISLILPFIVLPLTKLARSTRKVGLSGLAALAYFCLLGVAFLLIEIEFFHVFALALGNPTWTIATVLAGLLVSSGLGSLVAPRIAERSRAALAGIFLALASLLAAFVVGKEALLNALVTLPVPARVVGTILCIAPIGFLMGMPLPTGMRLIRHRPDLVVWGWALNGALSVLASVAAIYLAIHVGTSRTFAIGVACYLMAGALLQRLRARQAPA